MIQFGNGNNRNTEQESNMLTMTCSPNIANKIFFMSIASML